MRTALARHDHLIEQAVAQHAGQVVRPRGEGDSRFCVFARATDAVAAAAAIQHALQTEPWPTPARLKVRIALHTGEADLRDGDYYGSAVNRCARLRAIAHGGQTLLSQATADLARAGPHDGLGLRDMGEQRLSDLIAPEHVFQLRHPTLQDDFPPLRSLAAAPNNLPLQLTSFVGREADVAEVRALIAAHRLVTLTGTGGTGKTRLALQAAAELLDAYPDGVWFIDLAPLTDAALVPGAALAAIGAHEQPGRSAVETLIDLLGSKTALLVLDNCEHLLDASTLLADYLVHQCAGVRVLATSREVLGLGGEAIWRVPSLDTPGDGPGVLDELLRCDAIQLFLERARLVQRGFALTDANAAAVAQVCTRLDGIPLAIELAAARVAVLSAEQINERLSDRFRLLTGGSRTALRRQQTLRALVDWSHDILSPSERTLFRRLAVFRGGWTLEAAKSVGGGPEEPEDQRERIAPEEVLDLLAALVQKSLVVVEEDGGAIRYHLLETIRQYAEERLLDAAEGAAIRDRHRDWYAAFAHATQDEPDFDTPAMARHLAREHDNLRAAVAWCQDAQGATRIGLQLAIDAHRLWFLRGYGEAGRWLKIFLDAWREPDILRATALVRIAEWYRFGGLFALARVRASSTSRAGR